MAGADRHCPVCQTPLPGQAAAGEWVVCPGCNRPVQLPLETGITQRDLAINTNVPLRRRPWFRFGLKTLLAMPVLVALFFAVGMHHVVRYRRQYAAVQEVYRLGGRVKAKPGKPQWLGNLVGGEYYRDVTSIDLQYSNRPRKVGATGDILACLNQFPELDRLILTATPITDADLAHLPQPSQLRWLDVSHTKITDQGLAQLAGCTELWAFGAKETRISDEGLRHLKGLTALKELVLAGTCIDGSGFAHLGTLDQLQYLDLSRTAVNDAGLRCLNGLDGLQGLWLDETAVTGRGIDLLRLPGCEIEVGPPSNRPPIVTADAAEEGNGGRPSFNWTRTLLTDDSGCVTRVEFQGRWMGERELSILAGLSKVKALDLSGTGNTDVALARVANMESVRTLNLSRSNASDTGLRHLQKLKGLRRVNTSGSQVTSQGVAELRREIPGIKVIFCADPRDIPGSL